MNFGHRVWDRKREKHVAGVSDTGFYPAPPHAGFGLLRKKEVNEGEARGKGGRSECCPWASISTCGWLYFVVSGSQQN